MKKFVIQIADTRLLVSNIDSLCGVQPECIANFISVYISVMVLWCNARQNNGTAVSKIRSCVRLLVWARIHRRLPWPKRFAAAPRNTTQ